MATANELHDDSESAIAAKPAFLRRAQIRGFKSIAYCDVTLEPLTVLVGRNGSGKSNFLEALEFLRDVLVHDANTAFNLHGGSAVLCKYPATDRLSFEIETEFTNDRTYRATYQVDLHAMRDDRQINIVNERLSFVDPEQGLLPLYVVNDGTVTLFPEVDVERTNGIFRQRKDRLLLSTLANPELSNLAHILVGMRFYNFRPEHIREHQPSFGSAILEGDGHNLSRVLHVLKEIGELDRVVAYLKAVVPDIVSIKPIAAADYETLQFLMNGRRDPIALFAHSISDGTLRVLASLVAAYQPEPGFVAIEEPETALHPAATRALVAAMDEATLQRQLLLTTHSPDLLDAPEIKPANVRVVQMVDGQTFIGPVDAASVEIVSRHLNTLGGLEREGQLELHADELARQQQMAAQTEARP